MKIKALIASLVLGSSSVAMAAPAVSFSVKARASLGTSVNARAAFGVPVQTRTAYGTTVVRDHRVIADDDCGPDGRPIYRPAVQPGYQSPPIWQPRPQVFRPLMLGAGLHFAGDGRTFITNPDPARRLDSLQISAAGGRTFIQQVYIQFDNGQEQVVRNLNATLTGNQSLTLDLDGSRRSVKRVVVYGKEINSGWAPAAGAFTLTAL